MRWNNRVKEDEVVRLKEVVKRVCSNADDVGMYKLIEHEIVVEPGTKPVRQAPRRMSSKMETFTQLEVKRMLEEN